MFPSAKALSRARDKLRELTSPRQGFKPVVQLICEVNDHLRHGKNYFAWGYFRTAFRGINGFVLERLTGHLKRRSQRPYRPPEGVSWYQHLHRLGLVDL